MNKEISPQNNAQIVHLSKGKPVTDSLTIAREFGRAHKNVIQSLSNLILDGTISRLEFKPRDYIDNRGKKQPMIELTERGALIAMPFIGGKKSRQGQIILVDAFLKMRDEINGAVPWKELRKAASTSYLAMTEMLQEARTEEGKITQGFHYANEAKMINSVLFGVGESINRDSMSNQELALLDKIEVKNAVLIGIGLPYQERKSLLQAYADKQRLIITSRYMQCLQREGASCTFTS